MVEVASKEATEQKAVSAGEGAGVHQFKAKLRFARITPRKLRYVVDLIRGKDYNTAEAILRVVPKRGSYFVKKLLESAMANATNIIREKNLDIDVNKLHITKAVVNEGPMFKRWTAAPQGRAMQIKKRLSHLEIVLEEREPAKTRVERNSKRNKEAKPKEEGAVAVKESKDAEEGKKEVVQKKKQSGQKKHKSEKNKGKEK